VLGNYLRPCRCSRCADRVHRGVAFAIGALTRLPILVFALPIAYLLLGAF
jgi:hypothetical protein